MPEPNAPDQCQRSRVVRLHVGFDAMKAEGGERVAQGELERFPSESVARGGRVGREAAIAALKAAADDLTEVHDGNKNVVLAPPAGERDEVGRLTPCDEVAKPGVVGGRTRPRMMERSAVRHHGEERRLVFEPQTSKSHPLAVLEHGTGAG